MGQQRYAFDLSHAEKPYESYNGLNVRLRYFVRVTVTGATRPPSSKSRSSSYKSANRPQKRTRRSRWRSGSRSVYISSLSMINPSII